MFQPLPTNTPLWNTRLPSRTANRQSTSPSQNVDKSFSLCLSLYVCLNVCLPVCPCHPASISLSARVAPSIRILWFYMYICVYMLIWDSRLQASACLFVIFLCHKIRPIVCLPGYQSLSVYLSLSLSVSLTTTPGSWSNLIRKRFPTATDHSRRQPIDHSTTGPNGLSMSFCVSPCTCFCVSLCLSVCLYVSLCFSVSPNVFLCLSTSLCVVCTSMSVCVSLRLSVYLYVFLCTSMSFSVSLSKSMCICMCVSTYVSLCSYPSFVSVFLCL